MQARHFLAENQRQTIADICEPGVYCTFAFYAIYSASAAQRRAEVITQSRRDTLISPHTCARISLREIERCLSSTSFFPRTHYVSAANKPTFSGLINLGNYSLSCRCFVDVVKSLSLSLSRISGTPRANTRMLQKRNKGERDEEKRQSSSSSSSEEMTALASSHP